MVDNFIEVPPSENHLKYVLLRTIPETYRKRTKWNKNRGVLRAVAKRGAMYL
jgi:hypothetical protein